MKTIIEITTKEQIPQDVINMCLQEIMAKLYIFNINGGDINVRTE